MCVAVDNGQIVANYSALPTIVVFGKRKLKTALSLNTMTDPEYAGKGLFITLANMLYEKNGQKRL
jgi:predicted acetyltransferase